MLRQISLVALLLLVQHCEAQPACTTDTAPTVCVAPLYKATCTSAKCECATGLTPTTAGDACELKVPTVKNDNSGKTYYTNVDYKLECSTTVSGVTYKWTKGTTEVTGATSSTYTIKETTQTAATNYKCEISIGGNKASSAEVSVAVVAPGKVCTADTDCTGTVFSGKCDLTDPKRCACAANYVAKEDTCKNGAAVVSTSLLLLLVVAVFSQLMKLY
ncbi:unnamed protein product [Lymnaea stagnalis]|uniref:Ig-like domain-containing protein n=1 Tax=Lymnaea stagnalis TaxID=6523 RepID=A0AAV2GZ48_LYMST